MLKANFFELGGHSLLATQVLVRISAHFHLDLPLRAFFECPTIRILAATIAQHRISRMEPISSHATPLVHAENGELDGLLEEVSLLSEEQTQSLLAEHDE